MNYYDALVIGGWKVDFLLIRSTENSRGIFFGGALYPPEDRYSTTDLAAVEAYQGVL